MILQTAAFLTAVGFITWVAGILLDYQGIATIGAALVIGVGAMIAANGLSYQSGEVRDYSYINESNTTVQDSAVIRHTYTQVATPQQLSLGMLVMLLGGVQVLRALNPEG